MEMTNDELRELARETIELLDDGVAVPSEDVRRLAEGILARVGPTR